MMQSLPEGYRALVIGASGAIGSALVQQLQSDPRCASVLGVSRQSMPGLDVLSEPSIQTCALALAAQGPFHLVLDATGALTVNGRGPEKRLDELDASHLLAALDMDMAFATSGEDAIVAAGVDRFDLILMDIRMPGMGGEAAMGQIRAGRGPNAEVPILAFTADVDGQATERLLGAGFDGHVPKPIDARALITSIVQWTAAA